MLFSVRAVGSCARTYGKFSIWFKKWVFHITRIRFHVKHGLLFLFLNKPRLIKPITAIGIGAGALFLWNFIAKTTALSTLNIFPGSIKNIHFDGVTPVMTMGLVAQNVSNQQIVINSVVANLYANSTLVGNLATFTPQTILPSSQMTFYIDIRLFPLSLVNDIIRSFQLGNFSQALALKGSMNADRYVLPIDMNFKIG